MLNYFRQIRRFLTFGSVAGLILAFILLWTMAIQTPAYVIYVNGDKKFAVKDPRTVTQVYNELKFQVKSSIGQDDNSVNLQIIRGFAKNSSIVATADIPNELKKVVNFNCAAAVVMVNGRPMVYVASKDIATSVLNTLKNLYSSPVVGEKVVSLKFQENVEVKEVVVQSQKILNEQQAYSLITTGTSSPEKYTVQAGDSLWLIARRNNMYVDDILKANNLTNQNLSLGQELILAKSKPYVNVVAVVEGRKNEDIPYETQVISDPSQSSRVRVKQNGSNGQRSIVYNATKVNGVVTERKITQENIVKQAVTRILVKGTKVVQVASRGSSRSLEWPTYGSISQYFSRFHSGIDIAGSKGSPIRAAESGTVTYAGWDGGYGNFIIINHGNGIITRYAHNSSIQVKVGQSVTAGQQIATLGSTGHSTGPHCHFEVLSGGSFVNPLSYLR